MSCPAPEQRTAFITGAASGIGRATAELFASEGWWVAATDLDAAGLDGLAAALGPESCSTWQLDVTDFPAYERVIAEVAEATGGRLDLLFNNAGIGAGGMFDEIPLATTRRVVDINLMGVVHGIYAAVPLLRATPGSLCFSTSSSAATFGAPGLAIYTATKFAVKGLTEALSVEFAAYGVRVADALPGVIDTAIFSTSEVYLGGERVDGAAGSASDRAQSEGPFRLLPPSDVAQAVWDCYQGEDRIHWYVPPDLAEIEHAKLEAAEAIRDMRINEMAAGLDHLRDEG